MSTALLIALVAVVAVVVILALAASRSARVRRDESRRLEAREHREEAAIRRARADAQEAEAEERAARARSEQARAEEQVAMAQQQRRAADERLEHANRLDPDVDDSDLDDGRDDRRELRPVHDGNGVPDGNGRHDREQAGATPIGDRTGPERTEAGPFGRRGDGGNTDVTRSRR